MAHRPAKRLVIPLVGILLLGAIIAIAALWNRQHTQHQATRGGITLYGNIDLREVQLAFNESARITSMPVQAGSRVHKGELLATLDDGRYAPALQRAQAEFDAASATLAKLLAGSRPQEIARLRAVVEADSATLKTKRLTYERIARLARQDAASPQSRDEARAARDAAIGQLDADREALKLALAGARKEDIAAARANVAAARASRNLARRALDDTRLYAPSDGVIRNRILEPGDMASPSQPVYTLALTNPLWARVYVDEKDLGRIKPGQPTTLSSDSFPGEHFKGWVGYISPTAEFTPKSVETTRVRSELVYQVRVYVCNAKNRLRLGMPVTVHIDTAAAPERNGATPCTPKQPQ